jgi:hypothetical protein
MEGAEEVPLVLQDPPDQRGQQGQQEQLGLVDLQEKQALPELQVPLAQQALRVTLELPVQREQQDYKGLLARLARLGPQVRPAQLEQPVPQALREPPAVQEQQAVQGRLAPQVPEI